jgi:hypothetical protein
LLIVGCVALVGSAGEEAVKEIDKQQRANSITAEQFRAVKLGSSQQAVEDKLGEPADAQEFESEGILQKEPENSSCIYYNKRGGQFGDLFQLCFTGGKLNSKNKL